MNIGLAVAVALATPMAANAAEWWYVGSTDRSAVFVDRESLAPVSLYGAPYAKASDTVSGGAAAPAVFATRNVRYYNCAERKIGLKNERSEGDRPDFNNAGQEYVFVDDIEKAKAVLRPRPGAPKSRVSAKFQLGVAEAYKPIF